MLRRLLLPLVAWVWAVAAVAAEPADSVAADSLPDGSWVRQLASTGFDLHDNRIQYPRFVRFCIGDL